MRLLYLLHDYLTHRQPGDLGKTDKHISLHTGTHNDGRAGKTGATKSIIYPALLKFHRQ